MNWRGDYLPADFVFCAIFAVKLIRISEPGFPAMPSLDRLGLEIRLDNVIVSFAWTLATDSNAGLRDGAHAVELAERACKLTNYKQTIMVGTLAAAYAEAGRFDDAIWMAEKACTLAFGSGEQDLLKRNQELLVLYRAHQPYHEPLEKLVPAAP